MPANGSLDKSCNIESMKKHDQRNRSARIGFKTEIEKVENCLVNSHVDVMNSEENVAITAALSFISAMRSQASFWARESAMCMSVTMKN